MQRMIEYIYEIIKTAVRTGRGRGAAQISAARTTWRSPWRRSPRGPRGELCNKNQVVEDGILEWSGSEEPLSDRRIDLLHKHCDTHITVQPRNTSLQ
jgi:hypothetical protein